MYWTQRRVRERARRDENFAGEFRRRELKRSLEFLGRKRRREMTSTALRAIDDNDQRPIFRILPR